MIGRLKIVAGALGLSTVVGAGVAIGTRVLVRRNFDAKLANIKAQELQRFLSKFDHELKNPLTAIRFALANLSAMTDDPDAQVAIRLIEAQTVRISQLITDLRKLVDFDRVSIEYIPFGVDELLFEAISLARTRPIGQQRTIHYRIEPQELIICGDKYLLLIAVFNLLDNALKYTEGLVDVSVWEEYESAIIEIRDAGPGIDTADLQHVWEELFRSERTQHVPGSGLGLAMVRAIVERHDGTVEIDSALETGTTATITLPAIRDC